METRDLRCHRLPTRSSLMTRGTMTTVQREPANSAIGHRVSHTDASGPEARGGQQRLPGSPAKNVSLSPVLTELPTRPP